MDFYIGYLKDRCRHHILYLLQLGLPFPDDARTLRAKANLETNQISN